MRKTIGSNPLDAVVPDLSAATQTAHNGHANGGKTRRAVKVVKERLTIHISVPLIDRAKNAVFWTPGLTLANLGEQALETLVSDLEAKNGGAFKERPHELRGGRPLK